MAKRRKRDPYEILGVGRDATADEVKAAFRKRAKDAHPDKNGGDSSAFVELKRSQIILSDPVRRARFDATGDFDEVTAAVNPDAAAIGIISGMIQQVLVGDIEPTEVDLVQKMLEHLDKEINAIKAAVIRHRRAQARVDRLRRRFKKTRKTARKDVDLLASVLDSNSRQAADAVNKGEDELKHRERAKEILADYDFEYQEAASHTIWQTTTWPS